MLEMITEQTFSLNNFMIIDIIQAESMMEQVYCVYLLLWHFSFW